MKILHPFSVVLIALQLTPSFSAPVSRNAGPDLIERQSQTSAQGDCTSQSVNGEPATVSGDCGQGNTGGNYTSGGTPPAVGSGNRNTTSGGGTTGTSGGTLTGNTGGTTTGNRYSTTGSGHGTKGSDGTSNMNSLKSAGNAAYPPLDEFTNKLKGESLGNVALPNIDEIFGKLPDEVSDGGTPDIGMGDITATGSRKRDLDNQADISMS